MSERTLGLEFDGHLTAQVLDVAAAWELIEKLPKESQFRWVCAFRNSEIASLAVGVWNPIAKLWVFIDDRGEVIRGGDPREAWTHFARVLP